MPRKKDISESYNRVKEFNGQRYTGMAVGRTHHWHYDQGDWKEKKVAPDAWQVTYSTTKRRVGHAPEGSGAPVGTGYHWFILAHQFVEKQNANDYTTQLVGMKLKLAHKRADKDHWSSSGAAQRRQLIAALEELIGTLKEEPRQLVPVPLEFDYKGQHYSGDAVPMLESCESGICQALDVTLNKQHIGVIRHSEKGWKLTELKPQGLVKTIGSEIEHWYEAA